MRHLTPKQKKFIKHYQQTGNATKAVKLAGYQTKNDNVAAVQGYDNLRNPMIINSLENNVQLFESAIVQTVKDWKDSENTRRREIAMQQAQYGHDKITGKATQRIETKNTTIEVKLDLSGVRLGTHYVEATPITTNKQEETKSKE